MYITFLFKIGECIYWVSFWGYKKYKPYCIYLGSPVVPLTPCFGSGFPSKVANQKKSTCPYYNVVTGLLRILRVLNRDESRGGGGPYNPY